MPQLTLTFPSGVAPMALEELAGSLEAAYGCEAETRGVAGESEYEESVRAYYGGDPFPNGSPFTLSQAERLTLVLALDHAIARPSDSGTIHGVRDLRERLRDGLR